MLICMRTTLNLDDSILKAAKARAVSEGETLTRVIEAALRLYLRPVASESPPFRLELLTKDSRPLPGTNLADRDALYDRMGGRA